MDASQALLEALLKDSRARDIAPVAASRMVPPDVLENYKDENGQVDMQRLGGDFLAEYAASEAAKASQSGQELDLQSAVDRFVSFQPETTGENSTPGLAADELQVMQAGPMNVAPEPAPNSPDGRLPQLAMASVRDVPLAPAVPGAPAGVDAAADTIGAFLFNVVDSAAMGTLDLLGLAGEKWFNKDENFWASLRTRRYMFGKDFGEGGIGGGDTVGGHIAQVAGQLAPFVPNLAGKAAGKAVTAVIAGAGRARAARVAKSTTPMVDRLRETMRAAQESGDAAKLVQAENEIRGVLKTGKSADRMIGRLHKEAGVSDELIAEAGSNPLTRILAGDAGEDTAEATAEMFRRVRMYQVMRKARGVDEALKQDWRTAGKFVPSTVVFRATAPASKAALKWTLGTLFKHGKTEGAIFGGTVNAVLSGKALGLGSELVSQETAEGIVRKAVNEQMKLARMGAQKRASTLSAALQSDIMADAASGRGLSWSVMNEFAKAGFDVTDDLVAAEVARLSKVGRQVAREAMEAATSAARGVKFNPKNPRDLVRLIFGVGEASVLPAAARAEAYGLTTGLAADITKRSLKMLDSSYSHMVNMVAMGVLHRSAAAATMPPEYWPADEDSPVGSMRRILKTAILGPDMKLGAPLDKPWEVALHGDDVIHDLFVGAAFATAPAMAQAGLRAVGVVNSGAPLSSTLKALVGKDYKNYAAAAEAVDVEVLKAWSEVSSSPSRSKLRRILTGDKNTSRHIDELATNPRALAAVASSYLKSLEESVPKGAARAEAFRAGKLPFTQNHVDALFSADVAAREAATKVVKDSLKHAYDQYMRINKAAKLGTLKADFFSNAASGVLTAVMSQPGLLWAGKDGWTTEEVKGLVQHSIFSYMAGSHPYTAMTAREYLSRPMSASAERETLRRFTAGKLAHLGVVEKDYVPPQDGIPGKSMNVQDGEAKALVDAIKATGSKLEKDLNNPDMVMAENGPMSQFMSEQEQRDLPYMHSLLLDYVADNGEFEQSGLVFGNGTSWKNSPEQMQNLRMFLRRFRANLKSKGLLRDGEDLAPRNGERGPVQRALANEYRRVSESIYELAERAYIDAQEVFGVGNTNPGRRQILKLNIRGNEELSAKWNDLVDILADNGIGFGGTTLQVNPHARPREVATGDPLERFKDDTPGLIKEAEMLRDVDEPGKGPTDADIVDAKQGKAEALARVKEYVAGQQDIGRNLRDIEMIKIAVDAFEQGLRQALGKDKGDDTVSLGQFVNIGENRLTTTAVSLSRRAYINSYISDTSDFWRGRRRRWTPDGAPISVESIFGLLKSAATRERIGVQVTSQEKGDILWLKRLDLRGLSEREQSQVRNLMNLLKANHLVYESDRIDDSVSSDMVRKLFFGKTTMLSDNTVGFNGHGGAREVLTDATGLIGLLDRMGFELHNDTAVDLVIKDIHDLNAGGRGARDKAAEAVFSARGIGHGFFARNYAGERYMLLPMRIRQMSPNGSMEAIQTGSPLGRQLRKVHDLLEANNGVLDDQQLIDLAKEGIEIDLTRQQIETLWEVGQRFREEGRVRGWAAEGFLNKRGEQVQGYLVTNQNAADVQRLGRFLDWYREFGDIEFTRNVQESFERMIEDSEAFFRPEQGRPQKKSSELRKLKAELQKRGILDASGKVKTMSTGNAAFLWHVIDSAMVTGKSVEVIRNGKHITGFKFKDASGIRELSEAIARELKGEGMARAITVYDQARASAESELEKWDAATRGRSEGDTLARLVRDIGINDVPSSSARVRAHFANWVDRINTERPDPATVDVSELRTALNDAARRAGHAQGDEIFARIRDLPRTRILSLVDFLTMPVIEVRTFGDHVAYETSPTSRIEMEYESQRGVDLAGEVGAVRHTGTWRSDTRVMGSGGKQRFMETASFIEVVVPEKYSLAKVEEYLAGTTNRVLSSHRDDSGRLVVTVVEDATPRMLVADGQGGQFVAIEMPNDTDKATAMAAGLRRQIGDWVNPDQMRNDVGNSFMRQTVTEMIRFADLLDHLVANNVEDPWKAFVSGSDEVRGFYDGLGMELPRNRMTLMRNMMRVSYNGALFGRTLYALGEMMDNAGSNEKLASDYRFRTKLVTGLSSTGVPARRLSGHMATTILDSAARDMGFANGLADFADHGLTFDAEGRPVLRYAVFNTTHGAETTADGSEYMVPQILDLYMRAMGFVNDGTPDGSLKARWQLRNLLSTLDNKPLITVNMDAMPTLERNRLAGLMSSDSIKILTGDVSRIVREAVWRDASGQIVDRPDLAIGRGESLRYDGEVIELPLEDLLFQSRIDPNHIGAATSLQEGNFKSRRFGNGMFATAYEAHMDLLGDMYRKLLEPSTYADNEVARMFALGRLERENADVDDISTMEQYLREGEGIASPTHLGFQRKLEQMLKSAALDDLAAKGKTRSGFRTPVAWDGRGTLGRDHIMAPDFARGVAVDKSRVTLAVSVGEGVTRLRPDGTAEPYEAEDQNREYWDWGQNPAHFNTPAQGAEAGDRSDMVYFGLSDMAPLKRIIVNRLSSPVQGGTAGLELGLSRLAIGSPERAQALADAMDWLIGPKMISGERLDQLVTRLAADLGRPDDGQLINQLLAVRRSVDNGPEVTLGGMMDALSMLFGRNQYRGTRRRLIDVGMAGIMHRNPMTQIHDTAPTVVMGFLERAEGAQFLANRSAVSRLFMGDYDKDEFDIRFDGNLDFMAEAVRMRGLSSGIPEPGTFGDTGYVADAKGASVVDDPDFVLAQQHQKANAGIGFFMKRMGSISQLVAKAPIYEYEEGRGQRIRISIRQELRDHPSGDPMVALQSLMSSYQARSATMANMMVDAQKKAAKGFDPRLMDRDGQFTIIAMRELFDVQRIDEHGNVIETLRPSTANDGSEYYAQAENALKVMQAAMEPAHSIRGLFSKDRQPDGTSRSPSLSKSLALANRYNLIHSAKNVTKTYAGVVKLQLAQMVGDDNPGFEHIVDTFSVVRYEHGSDQPIEMMAKRLAEISNTPHAGHSRQAYEFGPLWEMMTNAQALEKFVDTKSGSLELMRGELRKVYERSGLSMRGKYDFSPSSSIENTLKEFYGLMAQGRDPDSDPMLSDLKRQLQHAASVDEQLDSLPVTQRRHMSRYEEQVELGKWRDAMAVQLAKLFVSSSEIESAYGLDANDARVAARQLINRRNEMHREHMTGKKRIEDMQAELDELVRGYMKAYGADDPLPAAIFLLETQASGGHFNHNGVSRRPYKPFMSDILGALGRTATTETDYLNPNSQFMPSLLRVLARSAATIDAILKRDESLIHHLERAEQEALVRGRTSILEDPWFKSASDATQKMRLERQRAIALGDRLSAGFNEREQAARDELEAKTDTGEGRRRRLKEARLIAAVSRDMMRLPGNVDHRVNAYLQGTRRRNYFHGPLAGLLTEAESMLVTIGSRSASPDAVFRKMNAELAREFAKNEANESLKTENRSLYEERLEKAVTDGERSFMRSVVKMLELKRLPNADKGAWAKRIREIKIDLRGC